MQTLAEAFAEYRATYLNIYPPPPKPAQVAFDRRQVSLAMVFILCLTIYAATRTAAVIEITEAKSGYEETTARALAWVAVIGIEGMLLYMSITHTRVQKLYSQNHAWVLIVLGGIISALAGVSSGFGLFDEALTEFVTRWTGNVNIALTLVLGIGATVMVWASGEFIGTAIHNHRILGQLAEVAYRGQVDEYETTLRTRWDASPDKAAVSHDLHVLRARQEAELAAQQARTAAELTVLQRQAEFDAKFANTHREKGVDLLNLTPTGSPLPQARESQAPSQAQLAYQWLEQHPEAVTWTRETVPPVRTIEAGLQAQYGSTYSTQSITRGRERYVKAHFA